MTQKSHILVLQAITVLMTLRFQFLIYHKVAHTDFTGLRWKRYTEMTMQ